MATTLKEAVAKNSKVEGDCRVWTGSVTNRGRPVVTYTSEDGLVTVDIQRYLIGKKHNLPSHKRVSITTTCGNPKCISSSHLQMNPVKKPRTKKTVRLDCKTRDVEVNKKVFDLAITHKKKDIASETGLSIFQVNSVLNNKAMLPYFGLMLEDYLAAKETLLAEASELSDRTLMEKYKLSRFAINFIKSGESSNIHDQEAYLNLLSQCYVVGEHLVWGGKVMNGTPVYSLWTGALRNAKKLFVYSVSGEEPDHELQCNCGFESCINPYHLE